MATISEQMNGDQITLFLSGRVEVPIRKAFLTAIEQAKQSNPQKTVLNFSDVSFIDSAGLGLLMLTFGSQMAPRTREQTTPMPLTVSTDCPRMR